MTHPELQRHFESMRLTTEQWTVDSYFLVPRSQEEMLVLLKDAGLNLEEYWQLSASERKKLGWEEQHADVNGNFIFPADRHVLAHTAEDVMIPLDRLYRMHDYFRDTQTGLTLPLTTNLTAPAIKPGSRGPQTYEIRNTLGEPFEIAVSRLVCFADVLPMDKPYVPTGDEIGQFRSQTRGVIELGEVAA